MRLINRQELMKFPTGTLFCELNGEWYFGGLQLKGDTIVSGGRNVDFWVLQIDWIENDDTGEAIRRLDEMKADSSVSYPAEDAYGRHGLYDEERLYLAYESADTAALIKKLQGGQA
jgi:hypothetical protein